MLEGTLGGWTRCPQVVPSNPPHSGILGFFDTLKGTTNSSSFLQLTPAQGRVQGTETPFSSLLQGVIFQVRWDSKLVVWPQGTPHQPCSWLLACVCPNSCKHKYEQGAYVQRGVCLRVCVHRHTGTGTHGHGETGTRRRRPGCSPGCCRRRLRTPPVAPSISGFSHFLPIRDTSGYEPLRFRSRRFCFFYSQRQVKLLWGR